MMDEVQLVEGNRKCKAFSYPMPDRDGTILTRRNYILSSITESDISQEETIIDNPLIGHIPSKSEVIDELDSLLLSL